MKKLERKPYFRVSDVAELLGVSQMTVRRMIREGKLKAVRVKARGWYMIPRSEVKRLLKELRPG